MKQSKKELELYQFLKETFPTVVSNYLVPDVRLAGKHLVRVDCYVPEIKLVVEYDGAYWHKKRKKADTRKTKVLLKAGYTVVRVREKVDKYPLPELLVADPKYLELDYHFNDDFSSITSKTMVFLENLDSKLI